MNIAVIGKIIGIVFVAKVEKIPFNAADESFFTHAHEFFEDGNDHVPYNLTNNTQNRDDEQEQSQRRKILCGDDNAIGRDDNKQQANNTFSPAIGGFDPFF